MERFVEIINGYDCLRNICFSRALIFTPEVFFLCKKGMWAEGDTKNLSFFSVLHILFFKDKKWIVRLTFR